MRTTIILVRHGETAWNKEKRIQGQKNIPLSPTGIKQVEALAEKMPSLGISIIYSSALKRAYFSAKILTEKLKRPIIQDRGLNERSFGDFEGKLHSTVEEGLREDETLLTSSPPNGETLRRFRQRVMETMEAILKKHAGETILVVCHGGVMQVLISHFRAEELNKNEVGFQFANASIYLFQHTEKGYTEEART